MQKYRHKNISYRHHTVLNSSMVKVNYLIIAALAVLTLSGCGESGEIKRSVKDALIDPDSARFRGDVVKSKDGNVACIEVNAKNKFGGYTGFSSAILRKSDGKWGNPIMMENVMENMNCGYWVDLVSK